MHLTSSPLDWYAARAGGVVAYVLLSANVALGLLMTGKKSMKRWPRFALEDVHRFGGILVGTFLVLHIVAVAIDHGKARMADIEDQLLQFSGRLVDVEPVDVDARRHDRASGPIGER